MDRLHEQIARIDRDLHHIHVVRSTLTKREDILLRERQLLYNQLDHEKDTADDSV